MSKTLADIHFAKGTSRRPAGRPPKVERVDAQMSFLRILEVTKRPGLEHSANGALAIAISCEFNPTWVELVVGYQDGSRSSCTVDTTLQTNLQLRSAFGIDSCIRLKLAAMPCSNSPRSNP